MTRIRYAVPLLALSAFAASAPMRKEGIRASVVSTTGDSVRIDITGTVLISQGFLRGIHTFGAGRPFHATTPFTFFPSLASGPVEIRTVPGKHIKVVVENLIARTSVEGTGRVVELAKPDSAKAVQLWAKP